MARRSGYNPTKRNKELLSKINRRIRSKQRRLKKNFNVDIDDDIVGIKHLKDFTSNKEIRDYLKKQEKNEFLDRRKYRYVKNQHDVVFSLEEKKDFEKKIEQINKENRKQMKKLEQTPMKHSGKPLGYSAGENARFMGDSRINMFRERSANLNRYRSRGEFLRHKGAIDHRSNSNLLALNQQYRRNYIKALEENLNGEANHIIDLILELPLDQMVMISLSTTDADIDFLYSIEEIRAKVTTLESVWGYTGDGLEYVD